MPFHCVEGEVDVNVAVPAFVTVPAQSIPVPGAKLICVPDSKISVAPGSTMKLTPLLTVICAADNTRVTEPGFKRMETFGLMLSVPLI
jgi:hypothetical protein